MVHTAYDVLNGVETAELVALAFVALRLWYRQRGSTHFWLAITFGILGAVVTVGRAVPAHPHGAVDTLASKVLIAVLCAFPYALFRFTLTFSDRAARLRKPAAIATIVIVGWTFALPSIPQPGQHRAVDFVLFTAAILVVWTVLSVVVAVDLWTGARHEPTVARRRMRTLACAALSLDVALLVAGTASNSSRVTATSLATEGLVVLVVPLFWMGVSTPTFVLTAMRTADLAHLRAATIGLVLAATPAEVCEGVLPRVAAFIGGHGAAILNGSGDVAGAHELAPAQLAEMRMTAQAHQGRDGLFVADGELWLPLSAGWLVVVTTGFTPFFGREEATVLQSTGVLIDMALSRVELLAREREHVEAMRDFVAIASHDLRTPTAAIVGYAAMLERKWDTLPEQSKRDMAAAMNRQSGHLHRLVEDLLTMSRLDAGAMPGEPVLVDLAVAVDAIVSDIDIADVQVDVPAGLTAYIDPEHLRRILGNYVRNAQVYGEAPIRVFARRAGADVELAVADSGRGVSEQFAPRLFQKFARADKKTSNATGGTGLGLSIVKGLAEAARGTAWYAAGSPHGAVFGVTLPQSHSGASRHIDELPQQRDKEDGWTSGGSSSSSRTRKISAG